MGCLVRVKRVNGVIDDRDGTFLSRIQGEQRETWGPRWVVRKVGVVGLDKITDLNKTKKV